MKESPGRPETRGNTRSARVPSIIFDGVWRKLAEAHGGEDNLTFPKEIIWLNGAPGAGKTTNIGFIKVERSIRADPIVVSSLLNQPEVQHIKDKGLLVGDGLVTELVFEALLSPKFQAGVVVDGFPRTHAQAAICKFLHDKLLGLHRKHKASELNDNFPRPVFRIVVLFVDEITSVARQMLRAKKALANNQRVNETGQGELMEMRATDLDEKLTRKRYATFVDQTYDALKGLGNVFEFHFINANGPIDDVRRNIEEEMEYQSSIELDPEAFEIVSHLELASEVTMNARQRLVQRIDNYAAKYVDQFRQVAQAIQQEIYPVISRHAISGRCSHVTHSLVFLDDLRVQMAIDVLSERGFRVTSEPVVQGVKFAMSWSPPEKLGMTRNESPRSDKSPDLRSDSCSARSGCLPTAP